MRVARPVALLAQLGADRVGGRGESRSLPVGEVGELRELVFLEPVPCLGEDRRPVEAEERGRVDERPEARPLGVRGTGAVARR
jgi:hypothetical protein